MSEVIKSITESILQNKYTIVDIDKKKEDLEFILSFCEKIGIEDADIAVQKPEGFMEIPNDNTSDDAVSSLEIQRIYKNSLLDNNDLIKFYLDSLFSRRVDSSLSLVDYVMEDLIYLNILDNAANKMVASYSRYIDFLNDMNEELLKMIPTYDLYLAHIDTSHKNFLLLVLRLSWEIEYLNNWVETKERTRNSGFNKTEKVYKENARKKIFKKLSEDGVYRKWLDDGAELNQFSSHQVNKVIFDSIKQRKDYKTDMYDRALT